MQVLHSNAGGKTESVNHKMRETEFLSQSETYRKSILKNEATPVSSINKSNSCCNRAVRPGQSIEPKMSWPGQSI